MTSPRWLKRLGTSLLIGGQAIAATLRGRINRVELFDQLMEAGPGSVLIVLIISVAAGSVFNIQGGRGTHPHGGRLHRGRHPGDRSGP